MKNFKKTEKPNEEEEKLDAEILDQNWTTLIFRTKAFREFIKKGIALNVVLITLYALIEKKPLKIILVKNIRLIIKKMR